MLDRNAIEIAELSNHLEMITVRQPWAGTIHVDVFVKLGSADERRGEDKGLCHILEHMVFRGSEDYTEDEIVAKTVGRGGYTNAGTSSMYTHYYGWTPSEEFADLISVLDSVVFRPKLNAKTLSIEKRIVLEEIARSNSDANSVAYNKVFEGLTPNHHSASPTLGNEESIGGMKVTRMREYIRAFHRPQTAVLSICGDLPSELELEELLYENARGLVRKTRAANSVVLPRKFGDPTPVDDDVSSEETWGDHLQASSVVSSHYVDKSILEDEKKVLAWRVMSDIVGGNESSMMWREIRQESGLAYGCHSTQFSVNDFGHFITSFQTRSANVQRVEDIVDGIKAKVADGKFDDEAVEASKRNIIGGMRKSFDSVSGIGRAIARSFCYEEGQRMMPWEIEPTLAEVTKKDVVAIANEIFSSPKSTHRILDRGE